jgi:membrane protease YdiL (CAAX protease family)
MSGRGAFGRVLIALVGIQFFIPLAFLLLTGSQDRLDEAFIFPAAIVVQFLSFGVLFWLRSREGETAPIFPQGGILARIPGGCWHPLACLFATLALIAIASQPALALAELAKLTGIPLPLDPVKKQDLLLLLARHQSDWTFLGFAALGTVVAAPIAEEFIFRAWLYPYLKQKIGMRYAVFATGFVFGIIHFNFFAFLPLAVFGAYLCLVYEKTGDIRVPILIHGLHNLLSVVVTVVAGD